MINGCCALLPTALHEGSSDEQEHEHTEPTRTTSFHNDTVLPLASEATSHRYIAHGACSSIGHEAILRYGSTLNTIWRR